MSSRVHTHHVEEGSHEGRGTAAAGTPSSDPFCVVVVIISSVEGFLIVKKIS